MNKNEEDQYWEDRFRKLGKISPTRTGPYFYTRLETRLKARMEQSKTGFLLPWWLQRPSYAFGILGILIALNVSVALLQNNSPAEPEAIPGTYEAFVQDYQLERQTVYTDE